MIRFDLMLYVERVAVWSRSRLLLPCFRWTGHARTHNIVLSFVFAYRLRRTYAARRQK